MKRAPSLDRTPMLQDETVRSLSVIATVAAACFVFGLGASRCASADQHVASLTVYSAATPHFKNPNYVTSGSFPQVSSGSMNLDGVNAALRGAILADQRAYDKTAPAKKIPHGTTGIYRTGTNPRLISASTLLVSALIPDLELYPSGNDGAGWIEVTVRVPTGRLVEPLQLIAHGRRGVRAFEAAVGRYARESGHGIARIAYQQAAAGDFDFRVLRPSSSLTFWYLALTPAGLAVGTPNYVIPPAAGRIHVVVPYARLRPYLSILARQLIADVRPPASR
jgi:hypothetical protein